MNENRATSIRVQPDDDRRAAGAAACRAAVGGHRGRPTQHGYGEGSDRPRRPRSPAPSPYRRVVGALDTGSAIRGRCAPTLPRPRAPRGKRGIRHESLFGGPARISAASADELKVWVDVARTCSRPPRCRRPDLPGRSGSRATGAARAGRLRADARRAAGERSSRVAIAAGARARRHRRAHRPARPHLRTRPALHDFLQRGITAAHARAGDHRKGRGRAAAPHAPEGWRDGRRPIVAGVSPRTQARREGAFTWRQAPRLIRAGRGPGQIGQWDLRPRSRSEITSAAASDPSRPHSAGAAAGRPNMKPAA